MNSNIKKIIRAVALLSLCFPMIAWALSSYQQELTPITFTLGKHETGGLLGDFINCLIFRLPLITSIGILFFVLSKLIKKEIRATFGYLLLVVSFLASVFFVYNPELNKNNVLLKKERINEVYEAISSTDFANEEEAFYCPQYLILSDSWMLNRIIEKLPSNQKVINQYKPLCDAWLPEFYEKFINKSQFEEKPALENFYAEILWAKVMKKLYNESNNSYMLDLKEKNNCSLKNSLSKNCYNKKKKN